jgi:hypothetical protein
LACVVIFFEAILHLDERGFFVNEPVDCVFYKFFYAILDPGFVSFYRNRDLAHQLKVDSSQILELKGITNILEELTRVKFVFLNFEVTDFDICYVSEKTKLAEKVPACSVQNF